MDNEKILVTQSSIPELEEYVEEIKSIFETKWLTNMGEKHKKLEKELLDYLDVEQISLFTNGHMALVSAIKNMDLKGEVIIQTYNNKHYSIVLAKDHNYLSFYKEEMSIRKKLNYPPYYFITLVNISCKDYELGFEHANRIGDYLKKNLEENTIVLGPTMANMFKINNVYHFQCIIKYRHDSKLKSILKVLMSINFDKKIKGIVIKYKER